MTEISTNPFVFQTANRGKSIEVWNGDPCDPESMYVLSVKPNLIPHLIETLREAHDQFNPIIENLIQ